MIAFLSVFLSTILRGAPSDANSNNLRRNGAKPPEPRIIGGKEADDGRYPYFTLMRESSLCGGALIAPDLVVSAAHVRSGLVFRLVTTLFQSYAPGALTISPLVLL